MVLVFLSIFLLSFIPPMQNEREFTIVFLNKEPTDVSEDSLEIIYDQHLQYISAINNKNIGIKLTGSLGSGGGFLILNSSSIEEVEEFIGNSPGVFKGLYRPEYFNTKLRLGEFCDAEGSSLQRHNFVRYTSHITKYNVQHVPQLLKAHDDYIKEILKTGNVLAEGVFDNSDGGFMIIKGTLSTEVITNDPTVSAGFTIPEINDIWIYKGTFCNEYQGN